VSERISSPLPEDPGYWEELARRIGEDAEAPLARYAGAGEWYGIVSRGASWLVPGAAAAMLLLWFLLPGPSSPPPFLERSVLPSEPAGRLVGGPLPPGVDALLVHFAPEHGGTR
jgi:hypothetical protein